jgi:hypothetical protein
MPPFKTPNHPTDPDHANDLRRAYEHMGRVASMEISLMPAEAKTITALATLAQFQLENGNHKEAADLFRAAEHICFAALANDGSQTAPPSDGLLKAILRHYQQLIEKADEKWQRIGDGQGVLTAIYKASRTNASRTYKLGLYHQALEYAHAADALAHVKHHGIHKPAPVPKAPKTKTPKSKETEKEFAHQ